MTIGMARMNSIRVRNAMKILDSDELDESLLLLLNCNKSKVNQIKTLFTNFVFSINKDNSISKKLIHLKIWQLGNIDISKFNDEDEPIFMMSYFGSEKLKRNPNDEWYKTLLMNDSLA